MFVSPEKEHSVVDTGSPSVVGNKDNVASADCMDSHWRVPLEINYVQRGVVCGLDLFWSGP